MISIITSSYPICLETHKRTIAKTAIYRGSTTLFLGVLTWLYTGSIEQASFLTIVFNAGATVIYYVHERLWLKVKWGKKISL